MVEFNELRIVDNCLIIDASVSSLPYYKDVYIDTVVVDTQDTYLDNGPSDNPIFSYSEKEEDNNKNVRLELNPKTLKIHNDNLFFVYIITKGTPTINTPCGADKQITIGVAADLHPFYNKMMRSIREIDKVCTIPRTFIDGYLRYKALELSLKTCHYIDAIKIWSKFKSLNRESTNSSCKCHG